MGLLNALRFSRKSQSPEKSKQKHYGSRRAHLKYYVAVDRIVRGLASDAKSLIDVGSANATYADEFDWIPERVCLDKFVTRPSGKVRFIQADFFEYQPPRKFDFALCMQVLEHIEDAGAFARKLLAVSDRVLISVPYGWPEGSSQHHVHDPVDEAKVEEWFGRKPDYDVVVTELLDNGPKTQRYIAYFHGGDKKLGLKRAREDMQKRLS